MKILHLPYSTGGNSWGLACGERAIGLDSKVLTIDKNWLNYPTDICLNIDVKERYKLPYNIIKLFNAFLKVRNKYDVFHFNSGASLIDFSRYKMPLFELPYYPKDKKIIFTYNGCDIRQKYPTMKRVTFAACHEKECYSGVCNSGKIDEIRRQKIKIVEKYAHHIFALNPDLLYFLPEKATFLPYTVARWEEIERVDKPIDNVINIVHSPTNRVTKGSKFIIDAVTELQKKYTNINLIMVEKMPHNEALEVYRNAHIIIDQVLIGWYGGFAVEAMKMGKPVGVFIREEDLKFLPDGMAKDLKDAVINMNPFTIKETLELYLQNPSLLKQKSEASLAYVNKWHDPKYIAGITKSVYES